MNSIETWSKVDRYVTNLLVSHDPIFDAVLTANEKAGLPPHDVTPSQGKLSQLLLQFQGARTVLEIGTLGGYSTIWMARGLPEDGKVVTLESNPKHAEVARMNIERAGLSHKVEIRIGNALDTLQALDNEGCEAFDFIFIDADKPSNPAYLKWALKHSRRGSLIIGDNVIRDGAVADEANEDPSVQGVQSFLKLLAAEPRISATAIQTVGSKGYDGFALALVTHDE
jgi:predicted O-methyltransferase YrrM